MVDKTTFMETLRSVQEIAKTSQEPMSREEIQGYFQDMELSAEQQEMIYQYLQEPQGAAVKQAGASSPGKAGGQDCREKDEGKGPSCSAHFRMYLKGVSAVPVLTGEQKRTLYEKLLAGEESAVGELSAQWQQEIIQLAKDRHTGRVLLEDLVQEGNIGLLLGLRQFLGRAAEYGIGNSGAGLEEEQQRELERRVLTCITEEMEQYRQGLEGEAYSQNTILAKVALVYEAGKILAEENGTVPTVEELCEYTRIPQEEISNILALHEKARPD